jgi:ribose transport system substrate-binding protein
MFKTLRRLALAVPLVALAMGPALSQDRPVLGVALSSNTNPFYIAMRQGIEARAGEIGWDVRFSSVDEDVVQQVNGVLDLVAQGVDGILISPIDAVATRPAYDAAAEAGIPIMSIARHADSPNQTLYIAMDERRIGRDIANWLIAAIGGTGKIAMVSGPSGAATFRNLAEGFRERAAETPGIEIVFESSGGLTRERGLSVAEDILVAHPDVRGIYGGNDELGLGIAQAVGTAGMGGQVIVTGMNGVPPALAAVRRGDMGLTVELNPVAWGQLGVDTMAAYLAGTQIEQQVFIEHRLIDRNTN